jgi:hypothetical protein
LLDPRKNRKRQDADDWRSLLDIEENQKVSMIISNIAKKVNEEQPEEGKITFEWFYRELRSQKMRSISSQ